ncbi:alpha-galactosidase-like isoform X4 [Apium graveolens]|uniref:alpha-galactosidase-like isoform X4 n=1 Tax=Apium graveolens TaxID=4045 RepID=UPI003D7BA584
MIADAMVSTGLATAGYKYVNLDHCWAELNRDSHGNMVPRRSTSPSGMKALADYVHRKESERAVILCQDLYYMKNKMPRLLLPGYRLILSCICCIFIWEP